MELQKLGFNITLQKYVTGNKYNSFSIGRIILEHKERYRVITEKGEFDAEITGNMRFSANSRKDFPAVGDWVAIIIYETELCIIHSILPRTSIISRKAVGHKSETQIIATNIDYAFIVQSVDRDFNINRIERYLTICNVSKIKPVILLTKTDLANEETLNEIVISLKKRIEEIPVICISSITGNGYSDLVQFIQPTKTYCLLGSSGVGKSTLVNTLTGKNTMKTGNISNNTKKGKHVTTHRELIILENGGILIDNPGMREVGIADSGKGLELTFDRIISFSKHCKYSDCTHTHEKGCAVINAVADGEIEETSYLNYLKMEKEKSHFESSAAEKRKKDKDFGKMFKNYKKNYRKDI